MNTKIIYEAIYNMLILANTRLAQEDYEKLFTSSYEIKNQVLKNAYLGYKKSRPLCQDTGQVVVFLKIGQNIKLEGDFVNHVINKAVEDCYKDNFYRKSVVKDALFDRENTKTNTPCIIHTEFQKEDNISILVGIKGGGAENMTQLKMMNPTSTIDDVKGFIKKVVLDAKDNACPPMTVGVGVGGLAETAAISAKYALFKGKKFDIKLDKVIETKIITNPTHIACMPVCVNINCHSLRHSECIIKEDKIYYNFKDYSPENVNYETNAIKINTNDIEAIKNLKTDDKILLTGKIYTARDMAHKKIVDALMNNKKLPFELKNSIIYYAGPCPKKDDEIIGPIGPTTSKRMDKFAPILYKNGVIATIGKGERTFDKKGYIYLKATGGVALLYQECVKSCKIKAYEELGAEAIYELEVVDMPLSVEIV